MPPTRKAGGGRHASHLRKPKGGEMPPPKTFKLSISRSKVRKFETFGSLIFWRADRTFDLWIRSSKLLGN